MFNFTKYSISTYIFKCIYLRSPQQKEKLLHVCHKFLLCGCEEKAINIFMHKRLVLCRKLEKQKKNEILAAGANCKRLMMSSFEISTYDVFISFIAISIYTYIYVKC